MHFGKHSDGPVQRWILGSLGLLASVVLVLVSLSMNYSFGLTLGRTPEQGLIYAYASAAADIFKVLSPFFIAAAWRQRSWTWFGACALIWVITTSYGTVSATGHAALNRADMSGQRVVQADSYKDTRAALKRAQDDLAWIPKHRPADTAQADMEGLKASRLWSLSSECADPNGKSQREHCQTYFGLKGEIENAKKADLIEARIAEYTKKMEGAQGAAVSEADPQASMIAKLTRQDLSTVGIGLVILVILLLEVGSGLGPYVSIAYATGSRRPLTLDGTAVEIAGELKSSAKLALPAPGKAAGSDLLISKGEVTISWPSRPVPLGEAGELLRLIGMPTSPLKGDLRSKDSRDVLPWRFLGWLVAHGIVGEFPAEKIDDAYAEYSSLDHREPWGTRIVKSEMAAIRKYIWTSAPRAGADGSKRPTMWHIKPPAIPKLIELLKKNGATIPEPTEARKNVVVPFSDAAGDVLDAPLAAPVVADQVAKPVKGLGVFNRYIPDVDGMRALVRQQKAAFQIKMLTRNRKQSNRHRRSRAA